MNVPSIVFEQKIGCLEKIRKIEAQILALHKSVPGYRSTFADRGVKFPPHLTELFAGLLQHDSFIIAHAV